MRKSLAIAWIQFRMTLKSKATLATMFGMPAAFIIIFGLMLGGGGGDSDSTPKARVYPIAVVDQDQSLASTLLVEALGQEPNLALQSADREQVDKLLSDQKITAGLVIPQGFAERVSEGKPADLELVTSPGANLQVGIGPIVQRVSLQLTTDLNLAERMAGQADEAKIRSALAEIAAEREKRGVTLTAEALAKPVAETGGGYNALNHSALGYTVMAVMMSILLMAGTILYERQNGTWGRLLGTPVSRGSLLTGYVLSFYLTGMFQFLVLVLGTRFIFGIHWGPWLQLLAVGSAMVLSAAGIGLFFAGLVRTFEQQQTIGIVFVIATSMLGGLFWPLEFMNQTMQRIGFMTPQAWAMQALNEVALRGAAWVNLAWPLTVLLALGLLFASAGLLRVRYE